MFKAMIIKDLKKFAASVKLHILLILVFPIALSFIYGFLYQKQVNPDRNLTKIKVAFIDEDKSNYSKGIEDIFKNDKLKKFIDFNTETNMDVLKKKLKDSKIDAAIEIPKDFSNKVQGGKKADIKMIKSLTAGNETEIVYGIIKSYLDVINNNSMVTETLKNDIGSPRKINEISYRIIPNIVKLSTDNYSKISNIKLDKKITAKQYFAASMLAFIEFYILLIPVTMMIREVQDGTINRLMSTSATYFKVYVEKLVLTFGISTLFISTYIIINYILGNVWDKNIIEILTMIVLQAFLLTGIAAVVMNIFKSTKTLNMICGPIIMLLAFFGGAFYYIDDASLKFNFMKFTLNYWIGNAYNNLMLGNGLASITLNLSIIFIAGAIAIIIGTLMACKKNKIYG
ncbi:ABC transporter permease [Clostridium neuense]|uniref:ABC transporter permease n=1 Tax=Clostridium neuense TaxID=1728934 RepID=A0ABW8TDU1_9CLOT